MPQNKLADLVETENIARSGRSSKRKQIEINAQH